MKIKILLILTLLSSCTMAPWYKRPQAPVPLEKVEKSDKKKITEISWEKFFVSPDLRRIINLALENNRDLKVANLNIEAAQAAHSVARAALLPNVNATAIETRQKVPGAFAFFTPKRQFRANLNVTSYEVDFFGRLQSLKKAALEQVLAGQEARNVMRITLISETVNAYAQLLLDSAILRLMEETAQAQEERYRVSNLRYQAGLDSKILLYSQQAIYENAKTGYETYKKLVQQDQNALMVLTGVFDVKSLPIENSLDDLEINESLLDFVPSESLLSRPDIKQAEHLLKSANANIGAARAAFFPSITLTGTYGYGSRELSSLFSSRLWTFTPQINLPIFDGGRNFANLQSMNVQKKIQIAQYEKAIQTAFSEASNELANRESVVNQLKILKEIEKARESNLNFSQKRKALGIDNNADVLDAKVLWIQAKQNELSMKKDYIANLINLYKVFGGGSEFVEKEED